MRILGGTMVMLGGFIIAIVCHETGLLVHPSWFFGLGGGTMFVAILMDGLT